MDGNKLANHKLFSREFLALSFFSQRRDELERFGVSYEGDFAAYWKPVNGELGKIYFDNVAGNYVVIGDRSFVREFLAKIKIPEGDVCFAVEVPI